MSGLSFVVVECTGASVFLDGVVVQETWYQVIF